MRVAGVLGLVMGIFLGAGPAAAQDDAQAQATLDRAVAATERVDAYLTCVRAHERSLTDTVRLMRQARQQMRSGSADVRRDAAQSIQSLGQRVNRIIAELRACPPPVAAATGQVDENGAPIVRRGPPPDPTADAVAQQNDATRVVERDTRLSDSVRVQVGLQVDGFGHVDAGALRSAMSSISGRLDACYGQLLDRRALTRGTATLGFKVTRSGQTTQRQVIESSMGDGAFRQCLARAVSAIRVGQAPRGGDAEYSYTIAFGR